MPPIDPAELSTSGAVAKAIRGCEYQQVPSATVSSGAATQHDRPTVADVSQDPASRAYCEDGVSIHPDAEGDGELVVLTPPQPPLLNPCAARALLRILTAASRCSGR